MEPTCPIREHEARFQHLREVMELKIEAADKALLVQAAEYQRRLTELNHAAERLVAMQERFVQQPVYQAEHKALLDKVEKQGDALAGKAEAEDLAATQKILWGGGRGDTRDVAVVGALSVQVR